MLLDCNHDPTWRWMAWLLPSGHLLLVDTNQVSAKLGDKGTRLLGWKLEKFPQECVGASISVESSGNWVIFVREPGGIFGWTGTPRGVALSRLGFQDPTKEIPTSAVPPLALERWCAMLQITAPPKENPRAWDMFSVESGFPWRAKIRGQKNPIHGNKLWRLSWGGPVGSATRSATIFPVRRGEDLAWPPPFSWTRLGGLVTLRRGMWCTHTVGGYRRRLSRVFVEKRLPHEEGGMEDWKGLLWSIQFEPGHPPKVLIRTEASVRAIGDA
jgi:hypothetical protein